MVSDSDTGTISINLKTTEVKGETLYLFLPTVIYTKLVY